MDDHNSAALDAIPLWPRIAITGATGFVGRALLRHLENANVAALCRGGANRGRGISDQIRWISGDMDNKPTIETLVHGADVVIHLAGLTKAANADNFHRVNATATGRLALAAAQAGVKHFILLSSLAATRPDVSDYAASKAAGETEARAHAHQMPVSIIRAPAVFGPDDQATAQLFSLLARGMMIAPGGTDNRFSIIDVQDLARFIATLAQKGKPLETPVAPYSVHSVGFSDLSETTTRITGRRVRQITLPRPAVIILGKLADLKARLSEQPDVFSSGKVREIYAGDWLADHPVENATPFETTLHSCLLPWLKAKTAGKPCTQP